MDNRMSGFFPSHINEKGEIQTNTTHSYGVAHIAHKALSPIGLGETAFLLGLIHDCGKFTEEFCDYIVRATSGEKVKKGSVIHSFAAVSLLLNHFHSKKGEFSDAAAEVLACAAGSHHGLFDCVNQDGESGFRYRLEKQVSYDKKAIQHYFEECCDEAKLKQHWEKSLGEMIPVLEKCMELGKDDSETSFFVGLLTRLITSALIDGDRTDTAQFMSEKSKLLYPDCFDWSACLDRIRAYLGGFPAETNIQKARRNLSELCEKASEQRSGIYRLDMPTGAGKTLGALRYAVAHAAKYTKKRILYVVPLLSILDQNSKVIRSAVQDDAAILEHHSNVVKEDFSGEDLQKYELLSENWNAPIVITTMVLFLNALFGGQTTQIRRFSALCDSVVILDEVQSIPNKMLSLFNLAVTFLSEVCRATIILSSATQPTFENDKIDHHLLVPPQSLLDKMLLKQYEDVFTRTRILDRGSMRIEDIPTIAGRLLEDNRSVLVVCNKKSEAEIIYQACKNLDCLCFHLSASMCMRHRKDVLEKIGEALQSDQKIICVSTQVIEAGVDISFESVIRLTAGIDSIVQAAGRCNRNGEKESSDVYIVNASNEQLKGLVDTKVAQDATLMLLSAFHKDPARFGEKLSGEEAVQYYYQTLYGGFNRKYTEYALESGTTIFDLLSDGATPENYSEEYYLTQAFKTAGNAFEALDSNQTSVIVHYGDNDKLLQQLKSDKLSFEEQKGFLNRLKPYTVAVYDYQKKMYDEWGALQYFMEDTVLVLHKEYYSAETGLISRKEGTGKCNILIL